MIPWDFFFLKEVYAIIPLFCFVFDTVSCFALLRNSTVG